MAEGEVRSPLVDGPGEPMSLGALRVVEVARELEGTETVGMVGLGVGDAGAEV